MSGEAVEIGLSIRRLRLHRGWSRELLADRAAVSPRWLLEIEAGRADPRASAVVALARALEVEPAELLSQRGVSSVAESRKLAPEDQEAKRREFLGYLATTVAGVRLLDFERLAAPGPVDTHLLDDLEPLTDTIEGLWYTTATSSLLPIASGHLDGLTALLPGPPGLERRLASLIGRTALLVGQCQLKAVQVGRAAAKLALAESLAREAGDGTLWALVLTVRSAMFSAKWLGRPQQAVACLDTAASAAGDRAPALLRVVLMGRRAEDRAWLGDRAGALRDLEAAEASLPSRPLADDGLFYGARSAAELGALRGACELLLGQHREAVTTLEGTLAAMGPSLVSWRAAVLADQGAALARLGEVEAACAKLSLAVGLGQQATAGQHVRRAREVRRRELAAWSDSQAVRQLDERLRGDQ